MNAAKDIRPLLLDLGIHHVEIFINHVVAATEAWNNGLHKPDNEREARQRLVWINSAAVHAERELYEAGYDNLSFLAAHIGQLAGRALLNPGKLAGIGGSFNLNLRKIEKNPQWFKPFPRVAA